MCRWLAVDAYRNLSVKGNPVKLSLEITGVDIADCLVLRCAVIPEGDAARLPVKSNAELGTNAMLP